MSSFLSYSQHFFFCILLTIYHFNGSEKIVVSKLVVNEHPKRRDKSVIKISIRKYMGV